MKLEISASHDREDQTQAVFGLERVREVHDEPARNVGVSSLSTRRYRTLSRIAGPASFGNVSKLIVYQPRRMQDRVLLGNIKLPES